MGFLLFCDSDADGNITAYVAGNRIIPDRQYEHFFYLAEEIEPAEYKITNRLDTAELTLK